MPHNLTITYNRSQISITSTHPHVDLHVHTTTADHQGRRTEDFSLEISRPTHRPAPASPTPDHLHPNDHLPIASEATFASRLRVPQQQPPPLLDSYDAMAAYSGRYEPPPYNRPRQAARDAPAALGGTYYPPSPERDHDYASPSPGVERVHYDHDHDPGPGPGRAARPHDQPRRYPSPCISITPPTPSPDASRGQGAVVAARPAYCGGEMVLYGYGGGCGGGGYYDDDGGGGVWSGTYSDADAEDGSEWSGVGFGGEACGYR